MTTSNAYLPQRSRIGVCKRFVLWLLSWPMRCSSGPGHALSRQTGTAVQLLVLLSCIILRIILYVLVPGCGNNVRDNTLRKRTLSTADIQLTDHVRWWILSFPCGASISLGLARCELVMHADALSSLSITTFQYIYQA